MKTASPVLIGILLILRPFAAAAQGNLVLNGSFESFNFSGGDYVPFWHFESGMVIGGPAAQGSNFAYGVYFIYQNVPTAPGQTYQLRFAFGGNDAQQSNRQPLHVSFGSTDIAMIPITPVPGNSPQWNYLEFYRVAESDVTSLVFSTYPLGAFPMIDDVSVIAIPEPSGLSLLPLFAVSWVLCRHRRGLLHFGIRHVPDSSHSKLPAPTIFVMQKLIGF